VPFTSGFRARVFSHFSIKKGTIWCWLSTGLVYTKTISHLSVGGNHPAKDALVVGTREDDSSVRMLWDVFTVATTTHTLPLFGISLVLQYMLLKLKSLRTGMMI